MERAPLTVRIRLHELSLEWLEAVAELVAAVEDADPAMLDGSVADAAAGVRRVMFAAAEERAEADG